MIEKTQIPGKDFETEIEQFKELVNNTYVDWILEFIFMADEGEVDELKLGDILTVKVGEEF